MKTCVGIIHGIGTQDLHFADDLIASLKKFYSQSGKNPDDLYFRPIYWADLLDPSEKLVFERTNYTKDLGWLELRKVMAYYVGDAVGYQPLDDPNDPDDLQTYKRVNERVRSVLQDFSMNCPEAPVKILAHSLGTVVMSNFIWDAQHFKPETSAVSGAHAADKDYVRNIQGFYTFGSPIALWALRYKSLGVPIDMNPGAEWVNYYDTNDIIAYPLKNLNPGYKNVITDDVSVMVGNILEIWNPVCHIGYWESDDLIRTVARKL